VLSGALTCVYLCTQHVCVRCVRLFLHFGFDVTLCGVQLRSTIAAVIMPSPASSSTTSSIATSSPAAVAAQQQRRYWLLRYVYHHDVLNLRAPHRALHLRLSDEARQRGDVRTPTPICTTQLPTIRAVAEIYSCVEWCPK
jgi:hypothetical protein